MPVTHSTGKNRAHWRVNSQQYDGSERWSHTNTEWRLQQNSWRCTWLIIEAMAKVRVVKPGKSLTKGEEQYNASRRRSSRSVNSLNTSWGRWAFWRWDETARDWSRAHSDGFGTAAKAGCSPPGVKAVALPLTLDYHRFCFCFQISFK